MPSPTPLRPTFTVPLTAGREDAVARIRAGLSESVPANRWVGKGRWAEIHLPGDESRIWSPYLSLRVDDFDAHHRRAGHPESTRSVLFVRFAPRPEVWTGFVFLYAMIAFLTLLGGILAYVQWASGEAPWGGWVMAGGIPLLASLHLASWLGRRWSRDQMRELQALLEPVVAPLRAERE
ncbi:MAG: hypothetical protein RQ745_05395 [Longimicrobiales bacterium]|nr:hypothetical protein [Longimicrobiales bacterium]